MTQVRFVRTTHENGRFRSFPSKAMLFWREYGAVVGEALRTENSSTFAEIVTASREYAIDCSNPVLFQTLNEEHIAWCLIKLLEYGMARLISDASNLSHDVKQTTMEINSK